MNSMHRQFGKLMGKGAGEKSSVSVLLNDFEDADKMLTQIIEASKSWRDAWVSILGINVSTSILFEELYSPIVGTDDGGGRPAVLTPRQQLDRTSKLKDVYTELKSDLLNEVSLMDSRVIRPASDAKEYIQPIRKVIKKRDNKRLDWERFGDKVNNYQRKVKRTDRENAALVKAEEESATAAEEFRILDESLRETLPPIIAAAFSILPHLLAVQILIQNAILAQFYTALHNFCEDNGFASQPPPVEEVIAVWGSDFKPIQQEIERIAIIARGRAIHQPMSTADDTRKSSSVTGMNVRNGFASRQPPSSHARHASPHQEQRAVRVPSSQSIPTVAPPAPAPEPKPSPEPKPEHSLPDYSRHLTPVSSHTAHSPAGPSGDYFQRSSSATVQKKKPPPPPPKRIGAQSLAIFAVAQYTFQGQSEGDLSFKEGDQIKVLKKTDSTDDWWEGELRGVKGSFPANYCKLV
ncbi:uncharacterized protein L3040_008148 [Drepanopeziza brunnea f. sp. 'multigermtubi']|uniref:SH3 domain containing protein n=1 Tax=Marssonina brunnea f. sp. multigermtubi (strain MB_m1) TaxID=1072389 RepID=K1XDH7_MARBU|nr:SH3 domain containing protein [Drepanopeziza brunnea f. sp. 'multigermtubi' MB_m1]EKD18928.1 SH3 domain containing protein [Drepanopeziza brunnea f. sp. 'multigermtubi' MB_m1]KAJ5034880.1 hypothetical protein L3040_008148 [Drepanopeziza brunnea f. sp. 'multigermtubi']